MVIKAELLDTQASRFLNEVTTGFISKRILDKKLLLLPEKISLYNNINKKIERELLVEIERHSYELEGEGRFGRKKQKRMVKALCNLIEEIKESEFIINYDLVIKVASTHLGKDRIPIRRMAQVTVRNPYTGHVYIPPFYNPSKILEKFLSLINIREFRLTNIKDEKDILIVLRRAFLVHFWIVAIHPFADGNGRTARTLQNLILSSYSLPPVRIGKHEREMYMKVIEEAVESVLSTYGPYLKKIDTTPTLFGNNEGTVEPIFLVLTEKVVKLNDFLAEHLL